VTNNKPSARRSLQALSEHNVQSAAAILAETFEWWRSVWVACVLGDGSAAVITNY
jgi:hypothetical protein